MTDRRALIGVLLALPAVLAALGVTGVEAWRAARPGSALFAPPPAPSLASAIEWGELPQVVGYLRGREDPWAPFDVRHPVLTGDRPVRVSPLLWAVAVGNTDAVRLFVGLNVPVETPEDRQAACLADALGEEAIAVVLRASAVPFDEPCADPGGELPLVAVAGQAG